MDAPAIDDFITFCYTRDGAATWSFYEDVLGLPLVLDQGSCRIYKVGRGGFVGFCERDEAPEKPVGTLLTLVSEAVDEWYGYLRSKGVEVSGSPAHNPTYGIYHFFATDPDGHTIEIQRFDAPDWHGDLPPS